MSASKAALLQTLRESKKLGVEWTREDEIDGRAGDLRKALGRELTTDEVATLTAETEADFAAVRGGR